MPISLWLMAWWVKNLFIGFFSLKFHGLGACAVAPVPTGQCAGRSWTNQRRVGDDLLEGLFSTVFSLPWYHKLAASAFHGTFHSQDMGL